MIAFVGRLTELNGTFEPKYKRRLVLCLTSAWTARRT